MVGYTYGLPGLIISSYKDDTPAKCKTPTRSDSDKILLGILVFFML